MLKLKITNKLTTKISRIEILMSHSVNITFVYFQSNAMKRVKTTTFLKRYRHAFHHPLLGIASAKQPASSDEQTLLRYGSLQEMAYQAKVALITLIQHAPQLHTVLIYPTEAYLTTTRRKPIPFMIYNRCRKPQQLTFPLFHKLIGLRDPSTDYEYNEIFGFSTGFCLKHSQLTIEADQLFNPNKQLFSLLNMGQEPLYIRFIHRQIGFGTFASRAIKTGEVITFYNGIFNGGDKDSLYGFSLINDAFHAYIDASVLGNLARFINHSQETLPQQMMGVLAKDQSANVSQLAKPNAQTNYITYEGISFVYLTATRDITAHEQILFDYGPNYWAKGKQAVLLKNGDFISSEGKYLKHAPTLPLSYLCKLLFTALLTQHAFYGRVLVILGLMLLLMILIK